jgi:hypothetical protein
MKLRIDLGQEVDGRWIAEVPERLREKPAPADL